jgi:hypothetical protein
METQSQIQQPSFVNIEAEKSVVGWLCAGNGLETIRNFQPDIHPNWFVVFRPVIASAIQLDAKGCPVNGVSLTELLYSNGQLDKIGGASMLVPGHEGKSVLEYNLLKLRSLYRKRYLAEIGNDMIEGRMPPEEASKLLELIPPENPSDKYESRRFDLLNPPPIAVPIFTLAGVGICTAGNLSVISGQAKAGKSALVGAMIATLLNNEEHLGIQGINPSRHGVLHIDT